MNTNKYLTYRYSTKMTTNWLNKVLENEDISFINIERCNFNFEKNKWNLGNTKTWFNESEKFSKEEFEKIKYNYNDFNNPNYKNLQVFKCKNKIKEILNSGDKKRIKKLLKDFHTEKPKNEKSNKNRRISYVVLNTFKYNVIDIDNNKEFNKLNFDFKNEKRIPSRNSKYKNEEYLHYIFNKMNNCPKEVKLQYKINGINVFDFLNGQSSWYNLEDFFNFSNDKLIINNYNFDKLKPLLMEKEKTNKLIIQENIDIVEEPFIKCHNEFFIDNLELFDLKHIETYKNWLIFAGILKGHFGENGIKKFIKYSNDDVSMKDLNKVWKSAKICKNNFKWLLNHNKKDNLNKYVELEKKYNLYVEEKIKDRKFCMKKMRKLIKATQKQDNKNEIKEMYKYFEHFHVVINCLNYRGNIKVSYNDNNKMILEKDEEALSDTYFSQFWGKWKYTTFEEKKGKIKKVKKNIVITHWNEDEDKKYIEKLVFQPNYIEANKLDDETINMWDGWKCGKYNPNYKMTKEDEKLIEPIINWLKKVLFNIKSKDDYNNVLYQYFINNLKGVLLGLNFQVMTTFISPMGTGKNLFFDFFGQYVLGDKYFLSDGNFDDLFKTFNGQYMNKVLCIFDEMKIDKNDDFVKKMTELKKIITRKKIQIHRKNKTPREFDNVLNIFNLANSDPNFFIENGCKERRLIITESGDIYLDDLPIDGKIYKDKREFFNKMCIIYGLNNIKNFYQPNEEEIKLTEKRAFIFHHYIMNNKFEVLKELPMTNFKKQQIENITPFLYKFWFSLFTFLSTIVENIKIYNPSMVEILLTFIDEYCGLKHKDSIKGKYKKYINLHPNFALFNRDIFNISNDIKEFIRNNFYKRSSKSKYFYINDENKHKIKDVLKLFEKIYIFDEYNKEFFKKLYTINNEKMEYLDNDDELSSEFDL